jgi:hypothetical protein
MEENAEEPMSGSWNEALTLPSVALETAPGASPAWE